jgi:hypothetical protein
MFHDLLTSSAAITPGLAVMVIMTTVTIRPGTHGEDG